MTMMMTMMMMMMMIFDEQHTHWSEKALWKYRTRKSPYSKKSLKDERYVAINAYKFTIFELY